MNPLIATRWNPEREILGLMLDYDGTLAAIVEHPQEAYPTLEQIETLKSLLQCKTIKVAIVSGRSIQQLQDFLAPLTEMNLALCGLHGGEIYLPDEKRVLRESEGEDLALLVTGFQQTLVSQLARLGLWNTGWEIEDKKRSLALHFRRVQGELIQAKVVEAFLTVFQSAPVWTNHFKTQYGKQVVELVPIHFNKGNSVKMLHRYWTVQLKGNETLRCCYVGDDWTDEAAFQAVNRLGGLSIYVGAAGDPTMAQVRLNSIEALYKALTGLVAC